MLTLLKWIDKSHEDLSLPIRTDSQDAWIFRAPMDEDVIADSNFALGLPRCDNRIAEVLHQANYSVVNAAFAVHAIERSRGVRQGTLYSVKGAVIGEGRSVLISDRRFIDF